MLLSVLALGDYHRRGRPELMGSVRRKLFFHIKASLQPFQHLVVALGKYVCLLSDISHVQPSGKVPALGYFVRHLGYLVYGLQCRPGYEVAADSGGYYYAGQYIGRYLCHGAGHSHGGCGKGYAPYPGVPAVFEGDVAVVYVILLAAALSCAQYSVLKAGVSVEAFGVFPRHLVAVRVIYEAVYAVYVILETAFGLYGVVFTLQVVAVGLDSGKHPALHVLLHGEPAHRQHEHHYQCRHNDHEQRKPEYYYELYGYGLPELRPGLGSLTAVILCHILFFL